MAAQVDDEALSEARKGLVVIFIIGILASNIFLLFKFLRKGRLLQSQRKFLVMTLAGGDIFLALFSLVILARFSFKERFYISCKTTTVSSMYSESFLPFVYGVGIIVLCGELGFRKKLRSLISSPYVSSLLVAAIPWIAGLIFIVPLYLDGYDDLKCSYGGSMTFDRVRAIYVVSIVLPSALAVIFALMTSCKNVKTMSEYYNTSQLQGTVVSQTVVTYNAQGYPQQQYYPGPPQQQYYPGPPQQQYYPGPPQQQYYPGSPQQQNQPMPPPATAQQPYYPASQPPAYVSGPHDPGLKQPAYPPQPMPPSQAVIQTPVSSTQAASDQQLSAAVRNEQSTLVVVAVLYAVLTLPYALFQLGYTLNNDHIVLDPIPRTALSQLFLWMFYLRSIVTPIVWITREKTFA
ncbi:uncharacterized protein LOC101845830 [Aplysia californica]|uniref:Uncharacterized protein LOC101845830 n=1 Tax=Aplysia californica TaxID=6500 RepID=A0ABM0JF18_APLCA|nr:uncharacterized protein LOC101845830 [Aplysia californica]XP_005092225.1 uncharacterized protein LOC101845830 [Aplysia californica]